MAANRRVGGIIQFTINGVIYNAKGNYSYNLGKPMREAVIGSDGFHGFKETPQVAFIEGAITDTSEVSLETLVSIRDATILLKLANNKRIVLQEAFAAGEFSSSTEEGEISARFEGARADELST